MATDRQTEANVLYFPHIEISDSAWLKSALCVWDSVYRIVPSGYRPKDTDEIREAVEADALREISLSLADLKDAREQYRGFLAKVPFIPDGIDEPSKPSAKIHHEKVDQRLQAELAELLGAVVREGDWLQLPRGLADGYMLFLADVIARRRAIPKLTDSETMFVAMQYFAMDGNMDDMPWLKSPEADISAALVFRYVSPAGIHERSMKDVLKFRAKNAEGRRAFQNAVEDLSTKIAQVEDEQYARELVGSFIRVLQESEKITLARIREHFSQPENISLCLGLPLAAKIFEFLSKSQGSTATLGAVFFSFIYSLADVMKSRRKDWVSAQSTYLARLRQEFVGDSPIPKDMRDFGYMMNEFLND